MTSPTGVSERVTYDDKGRLDEIVGAGVTHLERMNTSDWFLEIGNADGTSTALWFKSKNLPTLLEQRDAPKRMTSPSKDRAEARKTLAQVTADILDGMSVAFAGTGGFSILRGRIAAALANAEREGMKRAAEICAEEEAAYLTPEYTTDQPLGSIAERCACRSCATSILAEITEAL